LRRQQRPRQLRPLQPARVQHPLREGHPAQRRSRAQRPLPRDEPADPRIQPLGAADPPDLSRHPATLAEELQTPPRRAHQLALRRHRSLEKCPPWGQEREWTFRPECPLLFLTPRWTFQLRRRMGRCEYSSTGRLPLCWRIPWILLFAA